MSQGSPDGAAGESRPFVGRVGLVGLVVAMFAASWLVKEQAFGACGAAPPFSFLPFELTFDAVKFRTLLGTAASVGTACREGVLRSLVMSDVLYPIAYSAALTALFAWTAQWRSRSVAAGIPWLTMRLPVAAAVLDVFAENVPLYLAGRLMPEGTGAIDGGVQTLVVLGSTGAALKFAALAVFALLLIATALVPARAGTPNPSP